MKVIGNVYAMNNSRLLCPINLVGRQSLMIRLSLDIQVSRLKVQKFKVHVGLHNLCDIYTTKRIG